MSARLVIRKDPGSKRLLVEAHGVQGTYEHALALLARDVLVGPDKINRDVVARRLNIVRRFRAVFQFDETADNETLADWCTELESQLDLAGVVVSMR